MIRIQRIFHYFDIFGQFILIAAAAIMAATAVVSKGDYGILYFALLFLIGCWQMLSAFIRGAGYQDASKIIYFCTALVYSILITALACVAGGMGRWEFPVLMWFFGFIPAVGAIWYLGDCIQPAKKMNEDERLDLVPSTLPPPRALKSLKKIRARQVLFRYL